MTATLAFVAYRFFYLVQDKKTYFQLNVKKEKKNPSLTYFIIFGLLPETLFCQNEVLIKELIEILRWSFIKIMINM